MQVTWLPIQDITPYKFSPNINEQIIDAIVLFIQNFGFKQPIIVDSQKKLVTGFVYWKAAQKLNLFEIPACILTDISDSELQQLRQEDSQKNILVELWHELLPLEQMVLKEILQQLNLIDQLSQLEISQTNSRKQTSSPKRRYTPLIRGLIYQPRMTEAPSIQDLYDDTELKLLLAKIDTCSLSPELAYFFRLAAHRFVRFRFDLIAEYYAHADEKIQRLMRELVLVIVDSNDAITRNVLRLSQELIDLILETETSNTKKEADSCLLSPPNEELES